MLNHNQPRTFSQALLHLGRIRSVEDSVIFGLWGLHKAKQYAKLDESEKQEVRRHLIDLQNFCTTFQLIVKEDKTGTEELKQIANANLGIETTRTIGSLAGIYSIIPTKSEREKEEDDVDSVKKILPRVLRGQASQSEIDSALEKLTRLRVVLNQNIESEKRESERIISGRPLIT